MPKPGQDLIVELVAVHGKRGVAYAVSSKGELVRRVDLLWGRHGELVVLDEEARRSPEEEDGVVK